MQYITLGVTSGVVTQYVPSADDGVSPAISVQFPFGSQFLSFVYVGSFFLKCLCIFPNYYYDNVYTQIGTNGYFTFDGFTGYSPFTFNENTTQSLVAPFFTDIDISGGGQIVYEVHTVTTSQSILSEVNSLINEHTQTQFNGEWLLVATWDNVPPYGDNSIVR